MNESAMTLSACENRLRAGFV